MNDDLLARTITGNATDDELSKVRAWRSFASENERHFQLLTRLLRAAQAADAERSVGAPPTAASIVEAAARADRRDRRHGSRGSIKRFRHARWVTAAAIAASVLLSVFGLTSRLSEEAATPSFGGQQFITGESDQGTVVLTDGTVVHLAPESRLVVPSGSSGREVSLLGRAYFAVAHGDQPFTVRTSSGDLRVLGTRFSIDAAEEDLRLIVVEGQVALAGTAGEDEVHVGAREMARVVRGTRLPVVHVPDPTELTDWVGSFLAFQNTPLHEALREIEREYDVTIEITDPVLADRTITAWFNGWELADVMEVVCVVASAECLLEEGVIKVAPSGPNVGAPQDRPLSVG